MIGKHNFMNIRTSRSNWKGKVGVTRGFVDFDSDESCLRAWYLILQSYIRRNPSINVRQMLETYAPASDGNNVDAYCRYVCSGSFDDDAPLKSLSFRAWVWLAYRMACMEVGSDDAPSWLLVSVMLGEMFYNAYYSPSKTL